MRSSKRVTASTMSSVVRPTYMPRLSDALGAPRGYTRAASSADSRGIQVQHEAEIWIFPTGADHLARDRQIHGEDEQVRGIVFEHFTAKHDHLGALRRDAQRGAQGGVGRPRSSFARGVWRTCPEAAAGTPRRGERTPRADWRAVGAPMGWA